MPKLFTDRMILSKAKRVTYLVTPLVILYMEWRQTVPLATAGVQSVNTSAMTLFNFSVMLIRVAIVGSNVRKRRTLSALQGVAV